MSIISNEDINLKLYLDDIRQYPLLTEEEIKYYFDRFRYGDLGAKQTIINSNLRLVVDIAKKYRNQNMALLDIIQEGNLGLFKAVERFDFSKGTKFSTYATYWINNTINYAIFNNSKTIRLPMWVHLDIRKYNKTQDMLKEMKSNNISIKDIAKAMDISEEKAIELSTLQQEIISLNSSVLEDGSEIGDILQDQDESVEDIVILSELSKNISRLFIDAKLTEKERMILELRYGLNNQNKYTQPEIAEMLSISHQRVTQIEQNSIRKIRNSHLIREYAIYMDCPKEAMQYINYYQEDLEEKRLKEKMKNRKIIS